MCAVGVDKARIRGASRGASFDPYAQPPGTVGSALMVVFSSSIMSAVSILAMSPEQYRIAKPAISK